MDAPIGGGGLITGVSTLTKMLNPNVKVIGVEPAAAASMTEALKERHPVTLASANTIADGTAVKRVGEKIFPYAEKNIDEVITVSDDDLIGAFLDVVENHKMIVENSGLLTVAALIRSGRNEFRHYETKWCQYDHQQCYPHILREHENQCHNDRHDS